MPDTKVNVVKRIWVILRRGYDPKFPGNQERIAAMEEQIRELDRQRDR